MSSGSSAVEEDFPAVVAQRMFGVHQNRVACAPACQRLYNVVLHTLLGSLDRILNSNGRTAHVKVASDVDAVVPNQRRVWIIGKRKVDHLVQAKREKKAIARSRFRVQGLGFRAHKLGLDKTDTLIQDIRSMAIGFRV